MPDIDVVRRALAYARLQLSLLESKDPEIQTQLDELQMQMSRILERYNEMFP